MMSKPHHKFPSPNLTPTSAHLNNLNNPTTWGNSCVCFGGLRSLVGEKLVAILSHRGTRRKRGRHVRHCFLHDQPTQPIFAQAASQKAMLTWYPPNKWQVFQTLVPAPPPPKATKTAVILRGQSNLRHAPRIQTRSFTSKGSGPKIRIWRRFFGETTLGR